MIIYIIYSLVFNILLWYCYHTAITIWSIVFQVYVYIFQLIIFTEK